MKSRFAKFVSIFLVIVLVAGTLPIRKGVFAAENETVAETEATNEDGDSDKKSASKPSPTAKPAKEEEKETAATVPETEATRETKETTEPETNKEDDRSGKDETGDNGKTPDSTSAPATEPSEEPTEETTAPAKKSGKQPDESAKTSGRNAGTEISSVSVTITEPKAGANPAYSVTVPSGVNYYSKNENYDNVCHDIIWYDVSIGQSLNPSSDKFQAGHQYEVTVYLTARAGYCFAEKVSATLNKKQAEATAFMYDPSVHTEEDKIRVVYRFDALAGDSNIITFVDVRLDAPSIGEYPDYDAEFPSGAQYETEDNTANLMRNGISWIEVDNDYMQPGVSKFVRNGVYCVEIYLVAKSGYNFDRNHLPTAMVNGNSVDKYDAWGDDATYMDGNLLHIQYTFPKLQANTNKYLSSASVTVTAPAIGKTPNYTATYPSGANYYSDGSNVTWYDVTNNNAEVSSSSTFQAGHKYLVSVYVTPKAGYYFDNSTKATLNNFSASINYINGKIRVYYTFAELKATAITSAAVTVSAPKAGNSPNYTATPASGANYTVSSGSVKWYDASNGNAVLSSSDKFKGGHKYKVEVTLTAKDGYCFNSSTTAKVNNDSNTTVSSTGTQLKVTYTFKELDLVAITSAAVTVSAPKAGNSPNYTATPASGANYTVSSGSVKWYDASNSNAVLSSSDKYKGGHKYTVEVYLIADDGYSFNGSTTAKVNNASATKTLEGSRLKVTYTFSALDLVTISSASVTVTAPAKDATPSFTATPASGANYTVTSGSVKWYDVSNNNAVMSSTGKFQAGHQYKVEAILTAKDGYGFTSSTTAKVNGYNATAALSNGQLKVTYTFSALDLVAISSVSVTVTAPKAGNTPVFTATPASGANYTVSGNIKWYDASNNNAAVSSTGKFLGGHKYMVEVLLTPKDGYCFNSSTTAKINNGSATVSVSGTQLKVTYTFSELDRVAISSVSLTVTEPKTGNSPSYTVTAESGANYTASSSNVKWYDVTNNNAVVSSSAKFQGGHKYMVEVLLTPKDGYCFNSSTTAKVNNASATKALDDAKLKVTYTFSALDLVAISSVSLTVTAPKKDANPSYTATPGSGANYAVYTDKNTNNFSKGIRWFDVTDNAAVNPSSGTFKAGHQYMVEVYLKANDGYCFDSTTAKVNSNSATAAKDGVYLKVTYTFKALDLTAISSVAITLTAPEKDMTPSFTPTIASGANYSVSSGSVKWYDVTNNDSVVSSGTKFKAGHQYKVELYLTPNEGYCFTSSTTAKVNTVTASDVEMDGGRLKVTYTFKAIPLTAISSVSVTITAPERDKKPVYTATLESGANYYYQSSGITWKDVTNNNAVVSSSSTFQAGHQYKVEIYLTAREGYCFNGNTTAKVNDKTAGKSVDNGQLKVTYTFDTIPLPDVNAKIYCYNELTKEKITDGSVSVSKNGDTPIRTGDDPIQITVKSTEKFTLTAGVVSGGYTFTGWYSGEYGKSGATLISNDPTINVEITGDTWFYATFTKPLTEISNLTFTADKAPVVGKYPKDCLPTVSVAEEGITVTGRSWKDASGNTMSSSQIFKAGNTYRLYVTYSVKTGYKLADDIKDHTTLNGKQPASHDTSKGTFYVSFTAGSFINVDGITVEGIVDKTYTGSAITQSPVVKRSGKALVEGTDYEVSYVDNINAGTATVVITGAGNYAGAKTVNFEILRADNTLSVKPKTAKVKYKKLKKKNQTLTVFKVLSFKSGGQGVKKYTKLSGNKKIVVNKTNGKVTVKKKLKKGTYKVKIKVMAIGNENYNESAWKIVTFRIRVK